VDQDKSPDGEEGGVACCVDLDAAVDDFEQTVRASRASTERRPALENGVEAFERWENRMGF